MLSHFDSNATEGAAAEFVKKYTEKYKAETLNQFGASAYDCIYAIYNAMKAAKEAGKKIDVTISASDLSDILKEQFTGDFTYSGVTGTDISWEDNGYVVKGAVKYDLKKAD
jgi:branched-chain amino acid transport system substrate-binding protein